MSRPFKTFSSDAPIFDCSQASCWFVNMTSGVNKPRVKHITPGVLYTFVIRQDAVGGHAFAWADNCINPPQISTVPNSTTTANFIGTPGQTITSHLPATWT